MKKLKNKKRVKNKKVKHKCQWEYSQSLSTPHESVWVCTQEDCWALFAEYEDAPSGG